MAAKLSDELREFVKTNIRGSSPHISVEVIDYAIDCWEKGEKAVTTIQSAVFDVCEAATAEPAEPQQEPEGS